MMTTALERHGKRLVIAFLAVQMWILVAVVAAPLFMPEPGTSLHALRESRREAVEPSHGDTCRDRGDARDAVNV